MHIIGGSLKNHTIDAPKGAHTRPTSSRLREALFNICQGYIEGARFLDLFAGSGAMGLEALSRGAAAATFVDNDRNSVRAIQSNLQKMGLEGHGKVMTGNVFSWLERLSKEPQGYTIIYADPPYDATLKSGGADITFSRALLEAVDRLPLLQPGGMFFIEDSKAFSGGTEGLKNLELISERRCGRSMLLQYRRLTN